MLRTPLRAVGASIGGHARPNPGLSIGRPAICACAAPQGQVQGAVTEIFFVKGLGKDYGQLRRGKINDYLVNSGAMEGLSQVG
jgi:hypothetical protein